MCPDVVFFLARVNSCIPFSLIEFTDDIIISKQQIVMETRPRPGGRLVIL